LLKTQEAGKTLKLQGRLQLLLRVNCFALQELNFVTEAESIKYVCRLIASVKLKRELLPV